MEIYTEPEPKTYEERLSALAACSIATHKVCILSDRWNVQGTFKFYSEEDAREFAFHMIEMARQVYGEELDEDGRVLESYSNEELRIDRESSVYLKGWEVAVYCRFPRSPSEGAESWSNGDEFLFGHRFGANRIAHPDSKVFVSYGGRDCDGYHWSFVKQYKNLREAAEDCDSQLQDSDGPVGWSMITRDQYEAY